LGRLDEPALNSYGAAMSPPERPEGERIAKLLARAGVASRREIERMIADGRVALNGAKVETPATILPHLRGVTVDGKPVAKAEPTRLYRFHKPAGLITAERDPAGRPTIYTALRNALPPGAPRLMPIGRLDFNTEGLLLLTNDGGFKREMELPATGVPRTYRARTYGDISQGRLEELMDGIEIEGVRYGPIDANMERRTGRNQWVELTLTEGKNREVRRVLEHLGLEVSRLIRTAYGPFALGDLAKGQALEVRKEELERFRSSLKGGFTQREGGRRPSKPPAPGPRTAPAPDGKPPRRPQRAKAGGGGRPGRPDAAAGAKSGRRPSSAPARGPKGPRT
jgi:23S rRNA pseudouridine2605 synthase